MSDLLNINNLSAGYAKDKFILKKFSLQLKDGERIGIIGQNGSGKSTLAKAILGLTPYTHGEMLWQQDINLISVSVEEKNNLGIAYFMQGGRVFGELSVLENLKLAYLNKKKNITFKELFNILKKIDLPLFHDNKRLELLAHNLSGGEKHILSFAMVFMGCPHMKLLIADEPSAGVAQVGQKQILKLMREILNQNHTALILIEQNKIFLEKLTKNILEITNQ